MWSYKYLHSCGKMTVVVLKTCSAWDTPPFTDEAQYFSLPGVGLTQLLNIWSMAAPNEVIRCGFHLRHAHLLDHFLGEIATSHEAAR